MNPIFKNNIFRLKINVREVRDKYKLSLDIPKWSQKTFGYKSLKVLGPKIWNNWPYHVKSSEKFDIFKNLLKNGMETRVSVTYVKKLLKNFIPSINYSAYFFKQISIENMLKLLVNPSLFYFSAFSIYLSNFQLTNIL